MRVEDGYRVWHGACHLDDAKMAPTDYNHFDGYIQGPETLCKYKSGEEVSGLNAGGWHDAGDFDLRIESQAGTVYGLALVQDYFAPDWDSTYIDQSKKLVRILSPDGKPDILQQIEHGLLSILGAWRSLGRLYRGIIEKELRNYVLIGDPLNHRHTRLVFTEANPRRELETAASLALAASALRDFNPDLAKESLSTATELWQRVVEKSKDIKSLGSSYLLAAGELFLAHKDRDIRLSYARALLEGYTALAENEEFSGFSFIWNTQGPARAYKELKSFIVDISSENKDIAKSWASFENLFLAQAKNAAEVLKTIARSNPYGIPYNPQVWGAGWGTQALARRIWMLVKTLPHVFNRDTVFKAFDFILGCHPGRNRASFISGVGTESVLVAYGMNRADSSYIAGGAISGTGLIGPDLPELLEWPFLWQQTEYVLGGGTTDWLFLALAVSSL